MASLAIFNRFQGSRVAEAAAEAMAQAGDERFFVRGIPNEDIYLFIKDVDNTRVVREADPQARGAAWKLLLSGGMMVALLFGLLLPGAYGRIYGYHVEQLKQERSRLFTEKAALEVEEAALLSPERLQQMAERQKLMDPGPRRFVYLDGGDGSLAMAK